ncbi:MAG: right-handed parallel beta-helix repeat-containing protein [Planctomycetota bacterium]|jgi:hypothetical protein
MSLSRLANRSALAAGCVAAAVAMTTPAHGGDGALIADSLAEFSSTQGSSNWHYGHDTGTGSFTPLCCYDPGGQPGGWWERAPGQPPWNLIWADGQQPDSTPTVRRWSSEVSGLIRVDVTTDHWSGQPGAKTVRVISAGELLYERVLAPGTSGPLTETVFTAVVRGGTVDFTVTADGDPSDAGALVRAEIYRLVVFVPEVSGPAVIEVPADLGQCVSGFVPAAPTVTASCQDGTIVMTPTRGDGLAIDDPYPLGITRIDWQVDELDCPNAPVVFTQWILVRADGCPDCNDNGQPDDCGVHNVTQDVFFVTIQGALDAAQPGDEIVVPPGPYPETLDFAGTQVTLRSADGPETTIIDLQGMNAAAVRCTSGEGPDTVLTGFTITGSGHDGDGGGLFISQSSPTVTGCVFRDNAVGGHGGGVFSTNDSHPTVTGCRFTGNVANRHGGGLYSSSGSISVTRCVFGGNTGFRGAGVYIEGAVLGRVHGCVFSGNSGPEGAGMWVGVFGDDATLTVTSSTFSDVLAGCDPQVEVANCILWDQAVVDPACLESHLYTHNDGVFGAAANNINADPLFVDPDGDDDVAGTEDDDLRLLPGSPCVDAGHNWPAARLAGPDLDGNPRFADGPADDTGCGIPVVVDMGAYELPGPPFAVQYGDIDGDGVVGITDFLMLLGNWGPCTDPCCLADLDLDGEIGITDFLLVLAGWTP